MYFKTQKKIRKSLLIFQKISQINKLLSIKTTVRLNVNEGDDEQPDLQGKEERWLIG